jgi:hypothetical protein
LRLRSPLAHFLTLFFCRKSEAAAVTAAAAATFLPTLVKQTRKHQFRSVPLVVADDDAFADFVFSGEKKESEKSFLFHQSNSTTDTFFRHSLPSFNFFSSFRRKRWTASNNNISTKIST